MILIAVVAELLEEYTAVVATILEQFLHDTPLPRGVRIFILRFRAFASSSSPPPSPLLAVD